MGDAPVHIDDARAIRLAADAAFEGRGVEPGVSASVTRRETRIVVEFVRAYDREDLHPDFEFRVVLDAATGAILEILGGT